LTRTPTGGTNAGSRSSNTATTGYTSGALGVLTPIDAIPQILNVSNVAGIQISNVGSGDVSSTMLLNLAKEINRVVCSDPTIAGAVVTHGTDTLEESAFLPRRNGQLRKPAVVVGAMRPATVISADGPYNLLEAVTVAVTPASRYRGVMVVLNDWIASGC
jgi:L-asparaginase